MSDGSQPEYTAEEIDAALKEAHDALFELNKDVFDATRVQIENVTLIRDAYLIQADRCQDIINLLASGAHLAATATGDMLLNLHGLTVDRPVDEEEETEQGDD